MCLKGKPFELFNIPVLERTKLITKRPQERGARTYGSGYDTLRGLFGVNSYDIIGLDVGHQLTSTDHGKFGI